MKRVDVIHIGLAIANVAVYTLVVVLALNLLVPLVAHWLGVTP